MVFPTRGRCIEILKRRGIPQHVIVHSLQVERVATYLGTRLNEMGEELNLGVIQAAALLHDIAKIDGLRTGENHARAGGEVIRGMGFPRVAEIVEQHVMVPSVPGLLKVTEDELVNYADKRVMHDRVVTLEERFADLEDRYGKNSESRVYIGNALERAREIERKIFRKLVIRPEDLRADLDGESSQNGRNNGPRARG
jgi:putative nucleotidyltransferase with HDIG domain